jgi:prevent-host-death family protein
MYTLRMERLSLTDARAQLPHLLDRVIKGESFTITRHGSDVAVLTGHDQWMKTKTHDVILEARALGLRIEAARSEPLSLPVTRSGEATADELVEEVRADREAWVKRGGHA